MFPEGNQQKSGGDRIESLRLILESEQGRSVSYAEAFEVGETLINFFEVLADDECESTESLDQEVA